MKSGVLGALASLLVGIGSAVAQNSDCNPCDGTIATPSPTGIWGSSEYLLWWFKDSQIPPLATSGGNGKIGSPGTRVLVNNLNFDDDVRQGGRFALGYQFAANPAIGVEANYFFLPARQNDFSFSSNGDPVLAQPFFNIGMRLPDANLVAMTGVAVGSVTIGARTGLWGTEANLTAGLICSDQFHLKALGGFRFLQLEDEVKSVERFQVAPNVPGFGGNRVTLQDEFRTINNFYGGQVGLESCAQFDRLTIDVRGKLALGGMHQVANVNGSVLATRPDGSTFGIPSGLYALPTNIGRYQRDDLAFIPEANVNIGWQLTNHVKLFTGYSFLWICRVTRAGEQIDPVINVTQFRFRSGDGVLVGPPRPAFDFGGSDFWAQGLSFGVEVRY